MLAGEENAVVVVLFAMEGVIVFVGGEARRTEDYLFTTCNNAPAWTCSRQEARSMCVVQNEAKRR